MRDRPPHRELRPLHESAAHYLRWLATVSSIFGTSSCNERYGKRTTTLYQAETKEVRLMQKIVNLYTHSHNYSITETYHE